MTFPIKYIFCCVSVLLLFFILYQKAYATSVEVRSGFGDIGAPSGDTAKSDSHPGVYGSFKQTDVDAVFNAGRRTDIFVGAEYTASNNATQDSGGIYGESNMKYSFRITTATFGLRIKPLISERWHLYLALGSIAGKARYIANFGDQPDLIPLSGTEDTSYFVRARFGVGAVIGLNKRLGVAIEGALTGSPPTFDVMVQNNNTGQFEKRKLSDGAEMLGITVGLRYTFGE